MGAEDEEANREGLQISGSASPQAPAYLFASVQALSVGASTRLTQGAFIHPFTYLKRSSGSSSKTPADHHSTNPELLRSETKSSQIVVAIDFASLCSSGSGVLVFSAARIAKWAEGVERGC